MTLSAPTRRPSIGDDGDTVLNAHTVTGVLPAWIAADVADALTAYGYARHDDDTDRDRLTDTGIALRDRWAAIRRDTLREQAPYGLLTPPSPGEIRDNEHPDGQGQSLLRGRH